MGSLLARNRYIQGLDIYLGRGTISEALAGRAGDVAHDDARQMWLPWSSVPWVVAI